MKSKNWVGLFVMIVAFFGCKDDSHEVIQIPIYASITHSFSEQALAFDSIQYVNAEGNKLSVTRLYYFLSEFTLTDADGREYTIPEVYYLDAKDASTLHLFLGFLPEGQYVRLAFHIGIVPEMNHFGYLENTIPINDMFWPEQMGGGYHFMKLEGRCIDTNEEMSGFALHLGTDNTLVHISLDEGFELSQLKNSISLNMDINEWMQNPNAYDLISGNYSMGDSTLMSLLTENGHDVFTLVN